MPGINRSTYIDEHEDRAIAAIAEKRCWSISQTIAELLRESPTLCEEISVANAQLATRNAEPETGHCETCGAKEGPQ